MEEGNIVLPRLKADWHWYCSCKWQKYPPSSLYLVTSPVQKFDWSNQVQDPPVLHTDCNLSECWQIFSTKQASVFSNDLSNHLLCFQHKWTEETFPPLHKIYIAKNINMRGHYHLLLESLRVTFTVNSKWGFVPHDQVSPLLVFYC